MDAPRLTADEPVANDGLSRRMALQRRCAGLVAALLVRDLGNDVAPGATPTLASAAG